MIPYEIGHRIKFKSEKKPYRVVAKNERYLICLKPFNLQRTYQYTIVDLVEKERGPDHWLLGNYDYSDPEELKEALKELESGKNRLSPRRSIDLDIEEQWPR